MKFPNALYDALKWVCLIALPAASVFYAVLDASFGWGYTDKVATVVSALTAFIGTLIGISTASYNGGGDK